MKNFKNKKSLEIKYPSILDCTIAIIGLGYVGLPLAVEFAKRETCFRTKKNLNRNVIGFDINQERIKELKSFFDRTNEIDKSSLEIASNNIIYTSDNKDLVNADVFIVTVPTPIDLNNRPNFEFIKKATEIVANAINEKSKSGKFNTPFVIYESTVYPGATEEICIPILEKLTHLKLNKGFFCGYSPERINPGDNHHRLPDIIKVTSGSNEDATKWIDLLYGSIIEAGTHKTKNIKVAEAAKVIENTQRDINIALINELAIIFDRLNINTQDVLNAAATKWNFQYFKPGLVGGHCIGVDPYYLTFKSEEVGYYPEMVLAGRRINNSMASFVVQKLVMELIRKNIINGKVNILILGLSFKENCPDIRNTKVIDIVHELDKYGISYEVFDPIVNKEEASKEYQLELHDEFPKNKKFEGVILAVSHTIFSSYDSKFWTKILKEEGVIFDLKGILSEEIDCIRL